MIPNHSILEGVHKNVIQNYSRPEETHKYVVTNC